jgi:hypothetical protein
MHCMSVGTVWTMPFSSFSLAILFFLAVQNLVLRSPSFNHSILDRWSHIIFRPYIKPHSSILLFHVFPLLARRWTEAAQASHVASRTSSLVMLANLTRPQECNFFIRDPSPLFKLPRSDICDMTRTSLFSIQHFLECQITFPENFILQCTLGWALSGFPCQRSTGQWYEHSETEWTTVAAKKISRQRSSATVRSKWTRTLLAYAHLLS